MSISITVGFFFFPSKCTFCTALMNLGGLRYPFMEAEAGELTVGDVEKLLSLYKDVVKKYTSLSRAVRHLAISKLEPSIPHLKGTNVTQEKPEEQLEKDQP